MRAVRLAAESLTVSARCTAPAPGTLDWPITLSRSRSVRPVPAVTVLLHEQIATVMQPSANMRGSDMSHSGESIVGKWYGNSSGISSRQYVASFLKDLDRWTDFHRIIVSSPQLVPRGNISGRPLIASTADAALDTIAGTPVDLIVTDYGMSRLNGIDLLQWLEKGGYRVPVIMMTDSANIHSAVDAMNAGAIGYQATPVREEAIEIAVGQALEVIRLRRENESLRGEINKLRSATGGPVFNLDELERWAIDRALAETGGNRARAAKLLGISERTLRNKLNAPKVVARGT
jgi:FixJ family two-component response regulator